MDTRLKQMSKGGVVVKGMPLLWGSSFTNEAAAVCFSSVFSLLSGDQSSSPLTLLWAQALEFTLATKTVSESHLTPVMTTSSFLIQLL